MTEEPKPKEPNPNTYMNEISIDLFSKRVVLSSDTEPFSKLLEESKKIAREFFNGDKKGGDYLS